MYCILSLEANVSKGSNKVKHATLARVTTHGLCSLTALYSNNISEKYVACLGRKITLHFLHRQESFF